jgi:signal transduction histidine kinase
MNEMQISAILNGYGQSTLGTTGETGYGFGLSIVKSLIESNSGELQITSEPGKGTTFRLCLPR